MILRTTGYITKTPMNEKSQLGKYICLTAEKDVSREELIKYRLTNDDLTLDEVTDIIANSFLNDSKSVYYDELSLVGYVKPSAGNLY